MRERASERAPKIEIHDGGSFGAEKVQFAFPLLRHRRRTRTLTHWDPQTLLGRDGTASGWGRAKGCKTALVLRDCSSTTK